jgi:hypothetical protein
MTATENTEVTEGRKKERMFRLLCGPADITDPKSKIGSSFHSRVEHITQTIAQEREADVRIGVSDHLTPTRQRGINP